MSETNSTSTTAESKPEVAKPQPVVVPPPVEPPPAASTAKPQPKTSSSNGSSGSIISKLRGGGGGGSGGGGNDSGDGEGAQMSFMDHLLELRKRLWTSIVAIFLCMMIALFFYNSIFRFLCVPLDNVNAGYTTVPLKYDALLKNLQLPPESKTEEVVRGIQNVHARSETFKAFLKGLQLPEADMNSSAGTDEVLKKLKAKKENSEEYGKLLAPIGLQSDATLDTTLDRLKGYHDSYQVFPKLLKDSLELPLDASVKDIQAKVEERSALYADYNNILNIFQLPQGSTKIFNLTSTTLLGTMMMVMWLGIGAGLVVSSPILLYEIWAFVAPGLRDREKNAIQPILFGGIGFFLGGCALNYYLLFPVTLNFVVWLDVQLLVKPMYTVDDYMSLMLNMMWITGLICEAPLVVGVLAKLSLVKPEYLTRYWRACVLVSFILGSIFSPGTDIMSMVVFSLLLLSLYVVSIFMAWFFYPKQKKTT